jgi:serine/threonine protein kinase
MSQGVALPAAPKRRGRRRPGVAQVGPGTDVGSYVVEAPLGAGGFGTVFRARRGGQLYALKLLSLAEVGPSAIREVLALSRVRHPNVVGLHGFWQWPDEQPQYLVVVMEYVQGRQLDAWTSAENPSAHGVLRRVLGVARGLVAVDAARLVHCDVKEANIIVRERDGEAVLVDFGVSAGQQSASREGGGLPPGTPDYRSPEAWRFWREKRWAQGEHYQPTSADDVYALGVVLYWMLTNAWPFYTGTPRGVEEVLTRAPVPPHERNPRVPLELSQLCLRMLDKRPEARPEPREVCQLVEEWLSRQGEEWEQPLCEAFSAHNITTDGLEVDDITQWLKQGREAQKRPRRGLRPPKHVPESAAPAQEAVPEAAAPPPEVPALAPAAPAAAEPVLTAVAESSASGANEAQARAVPVAAESAPIEQPGEPAPVNRVEVARHLAAPGLRRRVAVGLGLLAAVGALAFAFSTRGRAPTMPSAPVPSPGRTLPGAEPRAGLEPPLPTWESGWKVAPSLKPPEAEPAVTAASVAPGATAQEHEASVKTPQQKQPPRMKAAKKAAALLPLCTTLSCSGPTTEVRPPPVTAEPCPPGALKAMEQLGIGIFTRESAALLPEGGHEWIKRSDGWTTAETLGNWGKLPVETILSGRLIIGEKKYWVHFVQATTPQGKTYPVCLEGWGDVEEGKIYSTPDLKAVREFK